jgi:hypothetical protein
MKIGQVIINKVAKTALQIQYGLARIIILFCLHPTWRWKLGSGSFTEMVREEGDIIVQEKASYVHFGPIFIMYTRPGSG